MTTKKVNPFFLNEGDDILVNGLRLRIFEIGYKIQQGKKIYYLRAKEFCAVTYFEYEFENNEQTSESYIEKIIN